ncbi:hypothetical protein PGSY75_1453400 [Plasmodium gaboni]|uniref:Gamma tubulin complex component protein N-terminal domain-containing protein n=1 Tax=Plasmodium gaboni TaxID=647221 RepID=A0A151LAY9_9APIC|nr:hypothetical protein PGSY75_1453400 [Plasmodium gaboni]KYN96123.1 hypothetical protein PGSY75_1453400 [Plasmodium gaboni]
MTSTYINEIRKKQKEYLGYLFNKFEKYSNEKFLNNLITKSINEISLYPFQDVNDNEVVDDINDFINELIINAQYKKKSVFKHLCENFLSDNFYIYNENDRYELKYVILKLLFLISESSKNENIKQVDLLFQKYFSTKNKHNEKKQEKKNLQNGYMHKLNMNEKLALDEINNYNIQEQEKYLKEFYLDDSNYVNNDNYVEKRDDNFCSYDENKYNDDIYTQCSSASEQYEMTENKSKEKASDESIKMNNQETYEKNNCSDFYETQNGSMENYMKNKNELVYENVIKKIFECIYTYPYYEDNTNRIIKKKMPRSRKNNDIYTIPESDKCNNYNKDNSNKETKNLQKNHSNNVISISSDDDIFISMKRRQNKKSKYEKNMYKLKPKKQYFFNDINVYEEEIYENNNILENENDIIYETDIYNLRNVFFTDKKINHHEVRDKHEYDEDSNEYKNKEKKELSNQMYDKNIYLNDTNQVDNKLNDNIHNNNNNNNNNNNFIIDEVVKCKNQQINEIHNKICVNNKDMNEKKYIRRTDKLKSFYVSESFIIKEILMILSLNCPIKFKNNFYMNCSDFLFNKIMDKQKIKDDFLFYINIEKKKECYEKINGKTYKKKKKLFFEKLNEKNNISTICYHVVIKKMMNMKLYNIKNKIFNNYIKKMKKITKKLFYINMFICIMDNFRNFLSFLPYDLYDIFNYIINIKENMDNENAKNNNAFLSFLFNNMISVNIDNNKDHNNNNNNNNEKYNIYINSNCNSYNNYSEENFLNCFLRSLKNIYSEWVRIINILYSYHNFLILRQYDIVSVTKEQIVNLLKQIEDIKILKYLKLRHFIKYRKTKNGTDRKYEHYIRNKINNKENNNIYTKKYNMNMMNKDIISNNSRNNNNNNNYYYIDQDPIEEISSFRSLSLIRLNYLIINYLFMWDNIYDFINVILSYSLYDSNVYSYFYNNHKKKIHNKKLYSTHYDNAKKFCVCYDMFILYWRNSQILNNKYLEKVFRYFLDELNIYYSKYINDWIKKGQIYDKNNEFFICPEKNENVIYPYNYTTLDIKIENEFLLCPEFFHSFVSYIINLGNNIRLHMKINNEKNNIDYVDYYVREELNQYRNISKNNSDMYYNTYNKLPSVCNDDNSNDLLFFGEYTNNMKSLHLNTLNYYYNLENLKDDPNSSLDILYKFLKISKNKCLPYFNKNIISLNISYDIYIKKYIQEQFFEIYHRSNRIFLYSLMKYCYLLEYFSCLRSLVFLEINDYISPFFEFIFKENSFLIIDERNMNSIFRQCVYNNTNIILQKKKKKKKFYTDDGNYTCSFFLHQKFTLIHMKIILSKIKDMENNKKYQKKRILLHMQNDNKIIQTVNEYNNPPNFEERNYKKINSGKDNMSLQQNEEDPIYINNNNMKDDIIYEKYNTCADKNIFDNRNYNTIQYDNPNNIKCSSDLKIDENLRKYSICEKLTNTFYKEEIISNIYKNFYLKLKENTLYNNNINVISYRNLIIESKGSPFINFLFDSKCLEKYSAIFSYFLEIKKSFHILNLVYIFYKYVKSKKPVHFDNYYMILSSLCVLKYKIYFFINTLYTYFHWILKYSWNRFIINLSESKSLTHIKKNHESYINFLIETILIPIKTPHQELYNYYINEEYKDNDIYKQYEQKFFNSSIRKNDEDSNISSSPHYINNISSHNMDTNLLINNNSTNIIIDKTKNYSYVHQKQKYNNIKEHIIYKEKNGFLNKNSMDKQFLLNELFSNNILNLIFIPSQIYEILLKLSKFLKIKFDLNFDNSYYNTYENYYRNEFKTSEEYDEESNENSDNDMNDECNENSDNDIIKIKNNLLNTSQNDNNNNSNLKKLETEQFIFSIKNDIKALTKIFEINYTEFMKKLNIISFNAEDDTFFGPNKNYELFNHIIRLDKNILKKISILEYMLSFQSYNNTTDVIN